MRRSTCLLLTLLVVTVGFSLTAAAAVSGKTYRNTQFADTDAQTLTVVNDGYFPRTVYARFAMASDPGNRNYGFVQRIPAGGRLVYNLPAGTRVFACDGKYWDDYRPDERLMGEVAAGDSLTFTADEFRP